MRRQQQGFTLVELMTAIVVMSLIIAIALPNLKSAQLRSKTASLKQNAHIAEVMVTTYAADNGSKHPENVTTLWTAAVAGGYWKLLQNPYDKNNLALINVTTPNIGGCVAYEPAASYTKYFIYCYDALGNRVKHRGRDFVLTNS